MKHIINVRVENHDVVLFKLNSGETITKANLYMDMMMNSTKYTIKTKNGIKEISFNKDGTKIEEPPLEDIELINTL